MSVLSLAGFVRTPPDPSQPAGSYSFQIDRQSRCFDGHFEDAPVLPGVAQLVVVLSACQMLWPDGREVTGVRDIRFTRPLLPGDEIKVSLRGVEANSVKFEILCDGDLASSGVLVFAETVGRAS